MKMHSNKEILRSSRNSRPVAAAAHVTRERVELAVDSRIPRARRPARCARTVALMESISLDRIWGAVLTGGAV